MSKYIPALRLRVLTPVCDFFMRLTMREMLLKQSIVRRIQQQSRTNILDVGCGTATLTILLKHTIPDARIAGVDIDETILGIAGRKIASSSLPISLYHGSAEAIPFNDFSFDGVVSCLVFHHLAPEIKAAAAREIYRVLSGEGFVWIADFCKPRSTTIRFVVSYMKYFEETREHFEGRISDYLRDAGFVSVEETDYIETVFGPVSIAQAKKM